METPNFPLNNTFPATTTSQPNTSNQTPTTHHPEQKTKLPSHPPTPLLSPFQSHPRTLPPTVLSTPHNNNIQQQNPIQQPPTPIQTLHTFNLLHSIPAMPPTHPTVLELHHHPHPLPPNLQLEHDLRTLAIEGWYARHSHTDGFENAWDLNNNNNLPAQEELEEASLHAERGQWVRWAEVTRGGLGNGTGGMGNAHVENGEVVKAELGSSSHPLHLLRLHPRQGQYVVDGFANYEYRAWGGDIPQAVSYDNNNNGDNGDGPNGLKPGVSPDVLLTDVPATMAAGWEATMDGGEEFDPGPWEEIGRQWARIRPWELH